MESKIKNAKNLISTIDKKVKSWNERSQFTIKGVKNLSRSDLSTLKLYANTFVNNGGSISCFLPLRGGCKEVWEKYSL